MAVSIKKVTLWRTQVANKPAVLSGVLAPLAEAGADLQVVMGYHYHGAGDTAIIEVCPVSGKKSMAAAGKAGLKAAGIAAIVVQGDNKPGLGHAIAQAVGEAGINITFLVAQVIGEQFSAIMGFDDEGDAKQASALVKKAAKRLEK